MRKPGSVKALEDFGRVRPSQSFLLRDFLFSTTAEIHGITIGRFEDGRGSAISDDRCPIVFFSTVIR